MLFRKLKSIKWHMLSYKMQLSTEKPLTLPVYLTQIMTAFMQP